MTVTFGCICFLVALNEAWLYGILQRYTSEATNTPESCDSASAWQSTSKQNISFPGWEIEGLEIGYILLFEIFKASDAIRLRNGKLPCTVSFLS